MADDGMLMNFSVGDLPAPKTSQQRFKGGSWTNRLQAKRAAQGRGKKKRPDDPNSVPVHARHTRGPASGSASHLDDFADPRPSKRRREDGVGPSPSLRRDQHARGHDARASKHGDAPPDSRNAQGGREVISSLFTYNPKPTTTVTAEAVDDAADERPPVPSNAPLVDGIDTFTSLGLSPTVAAHLLTKMDLKNPTAIQKAAVSQMLKEDSDAFIQSETGSGKTLAYLLPVVQRIMSLSDPMAGRRDSVRDTALHRDSGLFAIVLAPTRELCKQISVVLERLLGCAHYIVAGTVIGGEKKKSEKARLRKGLNILVATPGRLVDHLEHTKVLDIGNVRWLVLDEGDRLMELGFEEDITKIVSTLDQRKRKNTRSGLPDKRMTVLCSATLKTNVQKLGEISLKDAVLVKGEPGDADEGEATTAERTDTAFLAPAQLKQSYLVVPSKLRLVTLTALLKRTFARKGSVMKAIVFVSCADSVEFHFKAFTRATNDHVVQDTAAPATDSDSSLDSEPTPADTKAAPTRQVPADPESAAVATVLSTPENPVTLYKLHGSLPQATRTSIVRQFASTTSPSLLVATDVASRGLDLPNLELVIEYDPAFSSDDHLHRIGRTARLGRDGRAIIFLLPGKEEGYVEILKKSYRQTDGADTSRNVSHTSTDEVLRKGFLPQSGIVSSKPSDWESRATDYQLSVERWVLSSPALKELAKKAFQSQIRAYATHTAAERRFFDIKDLHLGHTAKSFGLRDAPGRVNVVGQGRKGHAGDSGVVLANKKRGLAEAGGLERTIDADEAARKMKEKVRNRKMMMGGGADEFNIA